MEKSLQLKAKIVRDIVFCENGHLFAGFETFTAEYFAKMTLSLSSYSNAAQILTELRSFAKLLIEKGSHNDLNRRLYQIISFCESILKDEQPYGDTLNKPHPSNLPDFIDSISSNDSCTISQRMGSLRAHGQNHFALLRHSKLKTSKSNLMNAPGPSLPIV
jgi:hypothetical protein